MGEIKSGFVDPDEELGLVMETPIVFGTEERCDMVSILTQSCWLPCGEQAWG